MQKTQYTDTVKRFGIHSLWIGIVLIALGSIGVIAPLFMARITELLLTGILVSGGILWIWHSIRSGAAWTDWLTPLMMSLLIQVVTIIATDLPATYEPR